MSLTLSAQSEMLTASRLREVAIYDPETGIFTSRLRRYKHAVGEVMGCPSPTGYWQMGIDGQTYRAHRLVWLYVHGEWPAGQIDHINGVRSDNRLCNLRESTATMNPQNKRKAHRNNLSTGILGVTRLKPSGLYKAQIQVDRRRIHIGVFDTAEAAHIAYVAKKRELHPFGTL